MNRNDLSLPKTLLKGLNNIISILDVAEFLVIFSLIMGALHLIMLYLRW